MKDNTRIYLIVFSASVCSLAFEITLTRIFSISLWYHFAFMVISIAMLGLGLSGTLLSLFPGMLKTSKIDRYYILQGISMILGYLLSNRIPFDPVRFQWSKIQFLYITGYYLLLLLPFLFTGLIIATAFHSMSKKSGILYAADLMGAGVGSIGILFLLHRLSPEYGLLFLSMSIMVLSLWLGKKKEKIVAVGSILCLVVLMAWVPGFLKIRISPYKELSQSLRYPGARHLDTFHDVFSRVDLFESPAVRYAPGLSLRYQDPLPRQTGCSIDADRTVAITAIRDRTRFNFLSFLPSALVYEIGKANDVLLIDPGGGLPVLLARHYRANHIQKIEANKLLVKLIQNRLRDFSGHIYSQNTRNGLARTWLKSRSTQYDIIDISRLNGTPSAVTGLSEGYCFTKEAFKEYWTHLNTDGYLSLNFYILPPHRHELRLLATIVETLRELDIDQPGQHLIAIRSWGNMCLLVKRSPLNIRDLSRAKHFAGQRMFDLVTYPGIRFEDSHRYIKTSNHLLFYAFQKIINPTQYRNFIDNYVFDIRPVVDDSPFFHYYLSFKNISQIYRLTGKKWDFFIREGYLIPLILLQVCFLSLILIMLPALVKKRQSPGYGPPKNTTTILLFFSLLGLGFMFVETVMIQKLILLLTDPLIAMSASLTAILIGAGIGGFLSFKIANLQKPGSILILPPVIILYIYLLPLITDITNRWAVTGKFLAIAIMILPIGVLLGLPFPMGMKMVGENQKNLIPWAWAVNGCLAVMAPILAMSISLSYGFNAILWIGALLYLLAFFSLSIYQKMLKNPAG